MTKTNFSFRQEKINSKNFVKNLNHSNRREDNINEKFIGKNISRDKIKDNVFIIDNRVFDNCESIEEVWEILENDFKNREDNFKDIKYKVSRDYKTQKPKLDENGNYIFQLDKNGNKIIDKRKSKKNSKKLQRTSNKTTNVNGKNVTEKVETSPIQEFVLQIGNKEEQPFGISDYNEYYRFMTEKLEEELKGGTLFKVVIHFDETTPHIHAFWTPYNFKTGNFDKEFINQRNNLEQIQNKLFHHSKTYLKEKDIHLNALQKKKHHSDAPSHLSIKEYKKSQDKKEVMEKQLKTVQDKDTKEIIDNIPQLGKGGDNLKKLIKRKLNKYSNTNFQDKQKEDLKKELSKVKKVSNEWETNYNLINTKYKTLNTNYTNVIEELDLKKEELTFMNVNMNKLVKQKISMNKDKETKFLETATTQEETIKTLQSKVKTQETEINSLNLINGNYGDLLKKYNQSIKDLKVYAGKVEELEDDLEVEKRYSSDLKSSNEGLEARVISLDKKVIDNEEMIIKCINGLDRNILEDKKTETVVNMEYLEDLCIKQKHKVNGIIDDYEDLRKNHNSLVTKYNNLNNIKNRNKIK